MKLDLLDYSNLTMLRDAAKKAQDKGDLSKARRYFRAAATLFNPNDPPDTYPIDVTYAQVDEYLDELFSITDAIKTRPQLTKHLDLALEQVQLNLFNLFLTAASSKSNQSLEDMINDT